MGPASARTASKYNMLSMADTLTPGEELLVLQVGAWRLMVPVRHVVRVAPAAMPVAVPGGDSARAMLEVAGQLLPVVFGRRLLGEATVTLAAANKVVLLQHGAQRVALWVDRIDEIDAYTPWKGEVPLSGEVGGFVAGFSAGPPALPVLDGPALVASAHAVG